MKNWNANDWVKFLLGVTVFLFLSTYIIGMFVLGQKTDEVNLQLRMRILDLLALIVMKLLVDKSGDNKEEK